MAIIGGLFGLLGRFAGRLLNSTLGWATTLLFGKVSGRNQTILVAIALGSLLWVATIAGIVLPGLGVFLLAFVPIPNGVDPWLVRVAMLALAVFLPLVIGSAAVAIAEPSSRPRALELARAILRGYPFAFVLALTIGLLAIVSIGRKARSLTRGWLDAHVPVIVKPGGYDQVLSDLERVLVDAGLVVVRRQASAFLSLPPRLLNRVAGKALGGVVPDRLMLLTGRDLEILVYPSDLAISGSRLAMARARAAVAAQLTHSPAYLTASAEAQRVEDALRAIAEAGRSKAEYLPKLRELDHDIASLTVPFDEWETVYRERLQVERELRADAPIGPQLGSAAMAPQPALAEWLVGAAGLALLTLDVALLLHGGLTGRTPVADRPPQVRGSLPMGRLRAQR